jgi:uncharacterized protein (TIGR02466 family)
VTEVFNLFPVPVLKTKLDYPVNEIEVLCQQEHSKNPTGVIKSNNGGWQSGNIVYPDSPFFFLSDIEKICQEFCKETLKIDKSILLKNAWVNINQKSNSNQSHTHPGCILSGVYYIKTPKGCGDIHFQHHSIDMMTRDWSNFINRNWYSEYNQYNSELWWLPSEEGRLYVFPSWIRHMVKPNMSDEERISISFNVG